MLRDLGLVVSLLGLGSSGCRPPAADAATCPEPVASPPGRRAALGVEARADHVVERSAEGGPEPLLLRHARLIDGTGGPPRDDVDVLLTGGRIEAVGTDIVVAEGIRELDLGGRTLLPGFIDAHVHLSFTPQASYDASVRVEMQSSDADRALDAAANALATLRAGFTTVRNLGGGFSDRSLRDAIEAGKVPGPRMLVANHAIGITGGHCDGTNGYEPRVLPDVQDYRVGVADGVDEARKAVRYQIKHGADVIKICATGGVMSQGDGVGAPQLDPQEMRVIVAEAIRAERRVAAHAHGTQGIVDALHAGVHSIEHGSILSDEAISLMKRNGTYLVPTTYVGRHVERLADSGSISAESAAKARDIAPKMRASFAKAHAAGVRIALGSDAGVFPHGLNAREFAEMVELGMTPMEAIVAGTRTAAELLGLQDVGTIAVGNLADVVVVDGDPLLDIRALEAPVVVIKGGVVQRTAPWAQP